MTPEITGLLIAIAMLVCLSAVLLLRTARAYDQDARVAKAVFGDDPQAAAPFAGLTAWLYWVGEKLRRLYTPTNISHLRGVIAASGFNPHRVLPILLGIKGVLMLLVPAVAIGIAFFVESLQIRIIIICAGFVVGILGPEMILGYLRRRFVTAIQRGTPEVLDLLVVCTESGMGMESALERVSQEMRHSNFSMSIVLNGLLDDLRILPNRRDAFTQLGRYEIVGLRRFGMMLSQSMQYGTPLGDALRAVAEELRRERMNTLEERAVKLPAKLIFPLILFIMPSLWIILLGSSFLHLIDSLSSLAHH